MLKTYFYLTLIHETNPDKILSRVSIEAFVKIERKDKELFNNLLNIKDSIRLISIDEEALRSDLMTCIADDQQIKKKLKWKWNKMNT